MRFSLLWPHTRVKACGPTVAGGPSESHVLMTAFPLLTHPDSPSYSFQIPRLPFPCLSFNLFSPSALAILLSSPSGPSPRLSLPPASLLFPLPWSPRLTLSPSPCPPPLVQPFLSLLSTSPYPPSPFSPPLDSPIPALPALSAALSPFTPAATRPSPPRIGLTVLALTAAPFASPLSRTLTTPLLHPCRTSRSGFWGGLSTLV